MQNLLKTLPLFIGISFLFTGCYTIVWDPSQEFPNEENYSDNNEFYGTEYFGSYGNYYETPWWVGVPVYISSPGNTTNKNQTKERTNNGTSDNSGRTSGTENIRNSGERGNTDRNSGTTTTAPTTTSSSGSTSSSTIIKTPPPTRDSGSNNNSTSNNTSTTSSSSSSNDNRSSGSSDTRNNSGSRNSGSGRK